jgi:hypothetical protein
MAEIGHREAVFAALSKLFLCDKWGHTPMEQGSYGESEHLTADRYVT